MKDILRAARISRFHQRGSVAVEAAAAIGVLAIFITAPSVYLAFYFFQYSAAQKAAHDAALYLSTSARWEMTTAGPDGDPASLTLARAIVAKEMTGLTSAPPPDPGIVCGYQQTPTTIGWKPCTTSNSQPLVTVAVSIDMAFIDPLTGEESDLAISAYTPMRYVGN